MLFQIDHRSLVTQIFVSELGQHWFGYYLHIIIIIIIIIIIMGSFILPS